ncbi:MAG TPA: DNA-formamidopyrimidine glycosylase, partial [Alcanivorax sp.]|nr:DNA-formamidopyrimidine glycosylase [Alcanivorax sp.]
MPELPEVETTRRGIEPHVAGRTLTAVTVREPRLRWPVDARVAELRDKRIVGLRRRAKYLLMDLGELHLGIHLGMSGT